MLKKAAAREAQECVGYRQVLHRRLHAGPETRERAAADIWCKATDHIPEQIQMIEGLMAKASLTKPATPSITTCSKFPRYADLARKDMKGQEAGARIAPSDAAQPRGLRPVESQPRRPEAADGMAQPLGHRLPWLAH